jgi:hypothetical protein
LLEVAGPDVGRQGVEIEDVLCFPLILGATVIGVLGVHNAPALSETDRVASTTALVPLSLALRNLRVLQTCSSRASSIS